MITFKCSSCGGEMTVSRSGDLVCSYCGSRSVFTDKDLRDYKEFRMRMLTYLSEISERPDPDETDRIWRHAERESFIMSDGRPLSVNYLFRGEQNGVNVFTTRKNVIFVFPAGETRAPERFSQMAEKIVYPSADIKGLADFFPTVSGVFELKGGKRVLSVSKDEESYPLSAFGSLPPEHAAWIVSRLENLCCVLEYSDVFHGGIDLESAFINARTHQAYLLGGWWNSSDCEGGSVNDLIAIRAAAKRVTGMSYDSAPAEFKRFVEGAPAEDAYEDFRLWDRVIEEGFKGRRFRKLDLSALNL